MLREYSRPKLPVMSGMLASVFPLTFTPPDALASPNRPLVWPTDANTSRPGWGRAFSSTSKPLLVAVPALAT